MLIAPLRAVAEALNYLKDMHLKQSQTERQKYYYHNKKAESGGDSGQKYRYVSIIMDGMDQAKTTLPHFPRTPKYMDEKQCIEYHLMGTLVFGYGLRGCYVDWSVKQQFPDDSNALLTSLERTLRRVQKTRLDRSEPMPEVLYLQLDNCSSNKNHWLLAYAFWLVHMGILQKVKISFLLVGHTHENIDQFFSRVSTAFRNERAMTLPQMIAIVRSCATPAPESVVETEMVNFKRWLDTMEPENLHQVKKQQVFVIKRNAEDKVILKAKRYSNSAFYGEEIEYLKTIPNEVDRHKVYPTAFKTPRHDVDEGGSSEADARKRRKKKSMQELLVETHSLLRKEKPAGWDDDADAWWSGFLHASEQLPEHGASDVRDEYVPLLKCGHTREVAAEVTIDDPSLNPDDVELVNPEHQPLCTTQRSAAARARRNADLTDLVVGQYVAMRPTSSQGSVANLERSADVVTPFWIAEVLSLDGPKGITVHWFGADVAAAKRDRLDDWSYFRFTPRYQTGNRRVRVTSSFRDKYACGILAYGFSLKRSNPVGGVPVTALALIKERMADLQEQAALDEELLGQEEEED